MRGKQVLRSLSRAVAAAVLVLAAAGLFLSLPAIAGETGLEVCNQTDKEVGVALGRRVGDGWQSEGWTPIAANSCATVLDEVLTQHYYYLYATDETGGAWQGSTFLCSRGRDFEIFGTEDCVARGYSRTPYFEVETAGAKHWTVALRPWTALFAWTRPLTSAHIQTRRADLASKHQLYELVTSANIAAPLPMLLRQSGTLEAGDRRQVFDAIQPFVKVRGAVATEVHVWLRGDAFAPEVQRVSFYHKGDHVVTVVRVDRGKFVLGIDPGR